MSSKKGLRLLPGLGSVGGLSGKADQDVLYYTFTNYNTPATIYSFAAQSGESSMYRQSAIDFDAANFESKQVFYQSKDGTQVTMIITLHLAVAGGAATRFKQL